MTRAYAEAARSLGVVISEHLEVTGFTTHASRLTGVQMGGEETITCNHLVIAAGSWSTQCGEWLGVDIPVHPAKGQILALRQPEQPLKHSLMVGAPQTLVRHGLGSDLFLVPKPDGMVPARGAIPFPLKSREQSNESLVPDTCLLTRLIL